MIKLTDKKHWYILSTTHCLEEADCYETLKNNNWVFFIFFGETVILMIKFRSFY